MAREILMHVGINMGPLIAGRPNVRGHSGYVFRWGEGWFEEIRDGGPGWLFQKDDKSAVDFEQICFLIFFGTGVGLVCQL